MWGELGIDPCDDPKAIRRAYAVRLKALDPDRDPAGFARLREALEWALATAETQKRTLQRRGDERGLEQPGRKQGGDDACCPSVCSETDEQGALDDGLQSDHVAAENNRDASLLDFELGAAEQAFLEPIEAALARSNAGEAIKLYHHAAATGAVPLHGAGDLLDRLFAIAVEDSAIERALFCQFARNVGWQEPLRDDDRSEVRRRVLARLAAEDWYDSLLAAADRKGNAGRKGTKLARLLLGRIGRSWRPRVDRAALKDLIDQYRVHETWLRDRIDPAWVTILERRWRRREILSHAILILFLAAMLLNGVRLFAADAVAGTLSVWMLLIGTGAAAFLLWLLKLLARSMRGLLKAPSAALGVKPPNDPQERLGWLEQQAELAYEAMFNAPAGSALAARYSDVKEFLNDAIALAYRLDHPGTAERLSQRLTEIKAIYRSQFPV